MSDAVAVDLDAPPPELRFRRQIRLGRAVVGIAKSGGVILSLAERDIRARYKQAALGVAWTVLTPLALMIAFTLFFRRVARVETDGAPYALFVYCGLLPWSFFSSAISGGGLSLLNNVSLLNRVACPREVFPLASVAVAAFDSVVSLVVLVAMFVAYGVVPGVYAAWVPVLFAIQLAFTLGVTLVIAAAVVYLRDIRHTVPLILQVGLFATPVGYGIGAVPRHLRIPYAVIDPLAPVIDAYRRTVLLGRAPDGPMLLAAAVVSLTVLVGGYGLFKRLEGGFADVA